jgi:lysophospholipase L1-like esterase
MTITATKTMARIGLGSVALLAATLATGCGSDSGGKTGDDAGNPDAGSPADAGSDAPAPVIIHPNPIISRTAQVFAQDATGAMSANASVVRDGMYHNGGWNAGTPTDTMRAWIALKLAAGPTRILFSWDDGGTYNYHPNVYDTAVYGFPGAYFLEVSADSTNGADGNWTKVATVDSNEWRTREHAVDFTGKSWVKMTITAVPTVLPEPNGVQIAEIDVHDISATAGLPEDTWFFMGDSITAFAYDRSSFRQPSFAALVNQASPAFMPAMINGGVGLETTVDGLARLPGDLLRNPEYRYWILGYGTNDGGGAVSMANFRTNLQSMVDMVKAAGRTPLIPRIPFATDNGHPAINAYNTVVDAVVAANSLMAAPDFYAFFTAHPEDFTCPPCGSPSRATDGLHPNDDGLKAMNKLWADTMRPLYP